MDKTRLIPSMFHRRLLALLGVMVSVLLLLGAQLMRLTLVEGEQWLRDAESRLSQRSYLPTHRGRILDRNGQTLAADRPSYDIAVEYEVITGQWPIRKAERQARREIGREAWKTMSANQRQAAVETRIPEWEARCEKLWHMIRRFGEMGEAELTRRRDEIIRQVERRASLYRARTRAEKGYDESKPLPYGEETQAHVLIEQVPDEVAYQFRRFDIEVPGVVDVPSTIRREYPWRENAAILHRGSLPEPLRSDEFQQVPLLGVADHIVGSVRDEVWKEDVERRPFELGRGEVDLGGYRPGDVVGSRGLERAYEDHLRGRRGMVTKNLETGHRTTTEPSPGGDVHTTIDIALQTRVQAILSPEFGLTRVHQYQLGWNLDGTPRRGKLPMGTPLNAAAVVLEVSTGEILAMVSMPTMSMGASMSELQQEIHAPSVNRPYEALYPPGSIMKPLVLTAAVMEGEHNLSEPIECTGHFFEQSKEFARCWIYREQYGFRTHGELKASEAIGRSCNIFFYTLADRLGMERLIDWFGRYGIGSPLDIGLELPEEFEARYDENWLGRLPTQEEIAALRMRGELDSATVFLGIGQGPVAWTPLHAANAFATLARGGVIHDATIVTADSELARPMNRRDMNLDHEVVAAALEGLRQSTMELYGTGNHIPYTNGHYEPIINAESVTVWGKTGTAQAPLYPRDMDGDGEIAEDEGIAKLDHAWFVGLVGPENGSPLFAISVVVEYGGSGGRCAGPVANQIIRALQAEGHLPGDPLAPPSGGTG